MSPGFMPSAGARSHLVSCTDTCVFVKIVSLPLWSKSAMAHEMPMQQCVTWCRRNTFSTTKSELGLGRSDVAVLEVEIKALVAGKVVVDKWRAFFRAEFGREYAGQVLVLDLDQLERAAAISSVSAATAATSSCWQRTLSLSATLSREKPN